MADEIFFSIIIYVDDENSLERCLKSIGNTEYVKIIIADPFCTQLTEDVCGKMAKKLGNERFCYVRAYDMSIGEAYNTAIPKIKGRYVSFIKSSMRYGVGALETVKEIAEKLERPKLISLCPWTVNERGEKLQYLMSPGAVKEGYEQIVLNDAPEKLQLMLGAYFIRCYIISSRERHMWFRTDLGDEALMEMTLELIAEVRGYVYVSALKLHYTVQAEDNVSGFIDQHEKWWYADALRGWVLPFAQKWAERNWPLRSYIRTALLYLVYARYNCNHNDRNKGVLEPQDVDELNSVAGRVLAFVDGELLWRKGTIQGVTIPRAMRLFFMDLRAKAQNAENEIIRYGDQLLLWTRHSNIGEGQEKLLESTGYRETPEREACVVTSFFTVERAEGHIPKYKSAYRENEILPVCDLKSEHVIISTINYIDGRLEIDGLLSLGNFLPKEQIKLALFRGQTAIKAEYSEVYGLKKVFGITYAHDYQFHVSVPVYVIGDKLEMYFAAEIDGNWLPLKIRVSSIYAHLSAVKGQYWHFGENWVLNLSGKNKLVLSAQTPAGLNKKETAFRNELSARAQKGDLGAERALAIREQYFARKKEFAGRRIWITFDKLYKAGDNGEYIFHYIASQNDGIEIRYLIKSDSPDYVRMSEAGDNILEWGTDEALITALFAEAILTTHASVALFAGVEKELQPYLCDLFSPINVCIQHGLTVQNIANFQNRLLDNLRLYVCASPNEIRNLERPIYGYGKGSLVLTGSPRYDGLHSRDMRQILITPTWRRGLAKSSNMGSPRGHSDCFRDSMYFCIYNRLINDEKVISCAKECGYRIIYMLHPVLSSQITDFDRNDFVEIVPAAGDISYEKILTESSLMITDYSGVQFDFAYMRKPIIYYHPKELPSHFEESEAYVYERDCFGEIIDDHDALVETLCGYMRNNCAEKDEYRERADRFFAYNDFNNCKRAYNAILEFINNIRMEEE